MEEQSGDQVDLAPLPTVYFTEGLVGADPIVATIEEKKQGIQMLEPEEQPRNPNSGRPVEDANLDPYIKLYPTVGPNRGLLIVFSYSFEGDDYRDVDCDCVMLKDLFSIKFGFKVVTFRNLNKKKTLETMKGLLPEGHSTVFIVVSSHGFEGQKKWDTEFSCCPADDGDDLVSVHEVVDIFSCNYPELVGVPKVYIFQMCRGGKSFELPQSATTDTKSVSNRVRPETVPQGRLYSDTLVAYSTLPGYESIRNIGNAKGSLYIQVLCDVFSKHAQSYHVLDLFRIVDQEFKKICCSATTTVEPRGFQDLYLNLALVDGVVEIRLNN